MVIGFDGSRAFVSKRTGTENYSYQLLKALSKIDRVNYYTVYVRGFPSTVYSLPSNFQFKIISFSRLWTQVGLAIQTFKDNLDVLFVPSHTLPIIRKPGLKTVVTVHDLGSEYLPSMHQIKQRLYLGFMQNFQLKTATKIIAVSQSTKKDLEKAGIDSDKINVVYEGYDREKFKVQNSKFKINQVIKKYNLMYKRYFLFVGTVQPRKNLERLIKAFAKWLGVLPARYPAVHPRSTSLTAATRRDALLAVTPRQRKLIIVGSKGWLSDEIYKLPRELGIEERVKFLGYVPEEDLPVLYCGAIALTFPSLFEGFGLPILEAQACGCPVITSDVSSMPEVAGPPAGGGTAAVYVDPYSVDDIVKGMIKVQSAKCKVQSVKAGFENVKRFSWGKCARETLEVLQRI